MRKTYKIGKHKKIIHILQKYEKNNILKLSSNKKKDRFTYLKKRILKTN
jgi:hypothetical protein